MYESCILIPSLTQGHAVRFFPPQVYIVFTYLTHRLYVWVTPKVLPIYTISQVYICMSKNCRYKSRTKYFQKCTAFSSHRHSHTCVCTWVTNCIYEARNVYMSHEQIIINVHNILVTSPFSGVCINMSHGLYIWGTKCVYESRTKYYQRARHSHCIAFLKCVYIYETQTVYMSHELYIRVTNNVLST